MTKQVFILENITLLDNSDIDKLYNTIYFKKFKQETDIYVDSKSSKIYCTKFFVNPDTSINENINLFIVYLTNKGVTLESYFLYTKIYFALDNLYYNDVEGFLYNSRSHINTLLSIIYYIIHNSLPTFEYIEKYIRDNNLNSFKIDLSSFNIIFEGVNIIMYKNNKLKFKNFTPQQIEKLINLVSLKYKLKNL